MVWEGIRQDWKDGCEVGIVVKERQVEAAARLGSTHPRGSKLGLGHHNQPRTSTMVKSSKCCLATTLLCFQ